MKSVRLSSWAIALIPLLLSTLVLLPERVYPRSATQTPVGQDYGLSLREALQGLLLLGLVLESALALLYAAIRSAVQHPFRRDGAFLALVHVLVLALWLGGLLFGVR